MKYPILESYNTDFTTLDKGGTSKILLSFRSSDIYNIRKNELVEL